MRISDWSSDVCSSDLRRFDTDEGWPSICDHARQGRHRLPRFNGGEMGLSAIGAQGHQRIRHKLLHPLAVAYATGIFVQQDHGVVGRAVVEIDRKSVV